jgi:hypothetical protein
VPPPEYSVVVPPLKVRRLGLCREAGIGAQDG